MKLAAFVALLLTASTAHAHFKLVSPASWAEQDALGGPQKSAPCGQADSGDPATPTNAVTEYATGATIEIEIDETVYHPGHYRVSLAQTMQELPADPPVTAGTTACGSTAINPNPTMPLLADGLLVHSSPFSTNQKMQVTLPAGMTCTNCVLQITEFMSQHGAPCYYHHCAMVTIKDNPATGSDAGTGGGGGGGDEGGCSVGGGSSLALLGLALFGLLLRRR